MEEVGDKHERDDGSPVAHTARSHPAGTSALPAHACFSLQHPCPRSGSPAAPAPTHVGSVRSKASQSSTPGTHRGTIISRLSLLARGSSRTLEARVTRSASRATVSPSTFGTIFSRRTRGTGGPRVSLERTNEKVTTQQPLPHPGCQSPCGPGTAVSPWGLLPHQGQLDCPLPPPVCLSHPLPCESSGQPAWLFQPMHTLLSLIQLESLLPPSLPSPSHWSSRKSSNLPVLTPQASALGDVAKQL